MAAEDLDSVHRLPVAADDVVDLVVHGQVVGEADSQHLDRVHSSDVWQCGWMIGLRLASSIREDYFNRLCSVELQVVCNSPRCDVIKLGVPGVDTAGLDDNISIVVRKVTCVGCSSPHRRFQPATVKRNS